MSSLPFLNLFSTIQQVDFSKLLANKKALVKHKKYKQKETVKSLFIQDFKIAVSDIFEE